MLKKLVKDYFSFSKRERVGVIILVFIIIVVFLMPKLLPEPSESINSAEREEFRMHTARLFKSSRAASSMSDTSLEGNAGLYRRKEYLVKDRDNEMPASSKKELFYFDPNILDEKGWARLGIKEKTISTIGNYLAKGGRFRQAGDLGKIYGLHKDEVDRLLPYVRINQTQAIAKQEQSEQSVQPERPRFQPRSYHAKSSSMVDLNTADTAMLIALPGIGSKLADRIIRFRDRLGGFYTVEQLSDIYGLADSTFQHLRPMLTVSPATLRLININTADAKALKELPYLRWQDANAIIEFRSRHGTFKAVNDLLAINIFSAEMLKKIAPYLSVE